MRSLTFKDSINRINLAFILGFIVTLLVSGTVIGSYPAKMSFAYGSSDSKYSYSSFSSLGSKLSPANSGANVRSANVALDTNSPGAGHSDIHYDPVSLAHPLNPTYSPSAIPPVSPSFSSSSSPYSSPASSASSPTSTSSSPIQITAGKIQDFGFSINNNNVAYTPNPLNLPSLVTNLAISLVSQSPSVRILGPSSWNLPSISSGSGQELTTQVFASPSLIGNPVFFTVNVQYIQNGHQQRASSFDLGAIVIGDIQLRLNNLGVRYIGNTPNLVGNILNQGNTPAQFTSVEMITQGQGQTQLLSLPNSSQYLGSIGVNSPVSFNIPLQQQNIATKGTNENISGGQYPVSLKITYSDDLKNIHDKVINSTVSLLDVQTLPPLGGINNNALPAALRDTQLTSTNGFVDTYWAANTARITSGNSSISSTILPAEQEVGPGEGPSILAVVLSNTAFSNINGIIGYLTLPSGFSALVGDGTPSNNVNRQQVATASYTNMVQSGQTYTLYFKVKIEKTATIGSHTATLRIYYFKVPELQPGQYSSQTFTIPFSLPGKVILDAVPKITSLNPGSSNNARIQLVNKGTADAHGVIVTVAGISGNSISGSNVASSGAQTGGSGNSSNSGNITTSGQTTTTSPTSSIPTVNIGTRTFDIGTLAANGTAEIDPIIYPSESAGGTLQNLNLQVSYSDANGNAKTSNFSVGYLVLPTPPEAGLSVSPFNAPPQSFSNSTSSFHSPSSSSSNTTNLNNTAGGNNSRNKSSGPSAGISVSPAHFESDLTAKTVNVNDNGRNNKYTTTMVPAIYKITGGSNNTGTTSAVGTDPTALSHGNTSSNNNNNINNANNDGINSTSLTLVAGSVQDMKFNVANNNNFPITNAVVSIASQSSDVKIVGNSLWSLPVLAANAAHTFSTKIYASTSLIGSPVSFLVTLQYISGAQSKMGSFILGGNVVGDIRVSVTDLAVNEVAGVPNLVGNLLNQGNTIGLFTTVQLMNQPFSSSNTSSSSTNAVSGGQAVDQHHHIHNGGVGSGKSGVTTQSSSANSSSSISSALPPPQYLGDLQPDSPLPFSIPLGIDLNSTAPGTYPVLIKVTYSDDLKNRHETVLNGPVQIQPQQPRGSSGQGGGILSFLGIGGGGGSHGRGGHGGGGGNNGIFGIPLLYLIIIIAAIVIAAIYLRRRRRSKSTKVITSEGEEGEITDEVDKEEDIESLIDSSKSGDSDKKGRSIGTSKQ